MLCLSLGENTEEGLPIALVPFLLIVFYDSLGIRWLFSYSTNHIERGNTDEVNDICNSIDIFIITYGLYSTVFVFDIFRNSSAHSKVNVKLIKSREDFAKNAALGNVLKLE